jgi:hypothetical protein
MHPSRSAAAVLGVSVGLFGLTRARSADAAEPRPVHLFVATSPAAADCPDTQRLQAAVDAQRSRAEGRPLDFAITVDRIAGTYVATVRVTGAAGGVRVLADRSPTCAALYEALAVTLALVADPEPTASAGTSNPRASARTRRSASARFGVNAAYTTRVTTDSAPAFGAALESRFGAWAFELDLRRWPASRIRNDPGPVTVELTSARAAGCFLVLGAWSSLWLRGCTSAQAGTLTGSAGPEYQRATSTSRPWFAAGLALAAGGSLFGALGWNATAEAFAPLGRETFSIERHDQPRVRVFETQFPGVWIGLGADTRIW